MAHLILLVGPPGSGKSSYCNQLKDFVRVSQDDQGKKGHMEVFNQALVEGKDIIVDRMNFSKEQRNRFLLPAKKAGYTTEIIVHHVPRDICFDRMMEREGHPTINGAAAWKGVGTGTRSEELNNQILENVKIEKARQANSALDTFFSKYERVSDLEADTVVRLGWNNPEIKCKTKAIGIDLDGTMCNIDHRLHYVKGEKKRWGDFFREIPNDTVNEWCRQLVWAMQEDHQIVYCSGRPDNTRRDSEDWLRRHGVGADFLYMRQRNDFRQDDIVKEIILEFELKPRYDILMVVDDRQQVVNMWRKHGITCLQCAPGDF